jgi:cis-3-alkyl-4-acyloxetan-2-one decarboxylase
MSRLLNTVSRGNVNGPTVVFIHGWPDTDVLFEKQYAYLGATYNMVSIQLPLYTQANIKGATPGFFGFTLDEVTDMTIATIQDITAKDKKKQAPMLVAHDWGAIISYLALAKAPTLVKKMVALDIGQHSKPTLKGICILLAYQWTLMFAYVLPSFLGNPLTRLVATIFRAPAASHAHSGMNFLYCQTWKLLLTGNAGALRKWNPPKVPVLYLYGRNKPLFFHSPRWLEHVDKQPGSKVVSYPGDHWFFTRSKSAEAVNREIASFLGE